MAQDMYDDYFVSKRQNLTGLSECPTSCNLMKIRSGNEFVENQKYINEKRSGTISFKLNEIITVATSNYSYIWLNFIAEVGGYVGLFLGYSVYQVTEVIEKILPQNLFSIRRNP